MEREKVHRLLRLGLEKGASDIHFQVGYLPLYRFHGDLVELRYKVLTPTDTEAIAKLLLEGDPRQANMNWNELDLAFELPGEGRFRVNISRQRRRWDRRFSRTDRETRLSPGTRYQRDLAAPFLSVALEG